MRTQIQCRDSKLQKKEKLIDLVIIIVITEIIILVIISNENKVKMKNIVLLTVMIVVSWKKLIIVIIATKLNVSNILLTINYFPQLIRYFFTTFTVHTSFLILD